MSKYTEDVRQGYRPSGQDLNPGPLEYEGVLLTALQFSATGFSKVV